MELFSVKNDYRDCIGCGVDSFENLIEFESKITKVSIASAFFDYQSIEDILSYIKTSGNKKSGVDFILVIDGYASGCYSDLKLRDKLRTKNDEIRRICRSSISGIYLAKSGSLFHSKGYLFESNSEGQIMFGSLNFTQQGLKKNEELVVRGLYAPGDKSVDSTLSKKFDKYVKNLISEKTAVRIDKIDIKERMQITGVREMFLDGRLYYESKEPDPFRFDLKLPEKIRLTISPIDDLLDAKTTGTIDIRKFTKTNVVHGGNKPERSLWKKYCIETCYGYWAPRTYQDEIASELDKKDGKEFYKKPR